VITFAVDTKANEAIDIIGDEANIPSAALQRIKRRLGA
jgi:hypothetical protein